MDERPPCLSSGRPRAEPAECAARRAWPDRDFSDALVFVSVAARKNSDSLPPERLNRGRLEGFAINWLRDNDGHADCAVRFDRISLLLLGPDRALIRHHIDAISCSAVPEEE